MYICILYIYWNFSFKTWIKAIRCSEDVNDDHVFLFWHQTLEVKLYLVNRLTPGLQSRARVLQFWAKRVMWYIQYVCIFHVEICYTCNIHYPVFFEGLGPCKFEAESSNKKDVSLC